MVQHLGIVALPCWGTHLSRYVQKAPHAGRSLQAELEMGLIFITHDMGVVAEIADRVVVMQSGEKVEESDVASIFRAPAHPYTRALLAAVPVLGSLRAQTLPMPFAQPGAPPPRPTANCCS
jgi:glutathione transport system ATP-binding protein